MCPPIEPVLAPEWALFRSGGKRITIVRFPLTGIVRLSVPVHSGVGAVRYAIYDPRDWPRQDLDAFMGRALPFLLQ